MKKIIILLTACIISTGFTQDTTIPYKCMIQMKNYSGENAYVVVSLLNPEGAYEKTLYVQGDDTQWYPDITHWWEFQGKKRADIDAVTGATIPAGTRVLTTLSIDPEKLDKGYSLRFESAVEDQPYYKEDMVCDLTKENLDKKWQGSGFIRYVRFIKP